MRFLYVLMTLLLVLLVAALAVAEPRPLGQSRPDTPDKTNPTTVEATDQDAEIPSSLVKADAQPAPERELSPMMVEIESLLEAEKLAVEERRVQMTQTTDMAQRVALMDEIHQLKTDTELEILRVQLRYAQQEGHLDTAQEIEAAIEFMTGPRPVPAPEPRPAPDSAHR